MTDDELAAKIVTRALERLRAMSHLANLDSPEQRQELFQLADLVHNAPEWLLKGDGTALDYLGSYATSPFTRTWLQEQLTDLR